MGPLKPRGQAEQQWEPHGRTGKCSQGGLQRPHRERVSSKHSQRMSVGQVLLIGHLVILGHQSYEPRPMPVGDGGHCSDI